MIESRAVEKINRIILEHDDIEFQEEAIGILINLSFANDSQINSLFKRGCVDALCEKLNSFQSMSVLQKSIQALTNFVSE